MTVSQILNPTVQITLRSWDESIALATAAVANLTLSEKVSLASGIGFGNVETPCVGGIAAVSKIGFPGLCLQDSPTGVRLAYNVSAFPASINVAATFDQQLMYNNGRYMGEELRDKGVNVQLGPVANMMRTPQGGRGWEAQGADPFLTGFTTANVIEGVQSNGVQSCLKHFVLNDQEAFRSDADPNHGDSIADKKTLMEYYVRPFKIAIDSAGPTSIMCSYNEVNGVNACNNAALFKILKEEVGFKGYVMTDWWALRSNIPEIDAANAGLDMVMPGTKVFSTNTCASDPTACWWGPSLVNETLAGLVNTSRIDDMATRILAGWYRTKQEQSYPTVNFNSNSPAAEELNVQRNHKAHIRAVGAASSILLKNDGVLPLKSSLKAISVIGMDAIYPPDGPNAGSDHGISPSGTLAQGWGSGTTYFPYLVAPLDAIKSVAESLNIAVKNSSDNWHPENVKAAAAGSDVSLVFVNSDSGEGYITVENFPGDRLNLSLWNNGDNLIEAVASEGPTVVVIHSPGAVNMPWLSHPNVSAVIMALMPGQESGNSIADVLFGAVNPSGRLPFTIGHNDSDYVTAINFTNPNVTYSEGPYFDYRWNQKYGIPALFPFGFGLSYTTFSYSNIQVSYACGNGSVFVSVDIANVGSTDGNEVAQVYLGYPSSVTDQPAKQLKGFAKSLIASGSTSTVTIEIPENIYSVYDVTSSSWVVPDGTYTFYVGSSSEDIKLSASITPASGCSGGYEVTTAAADNYGAVSAMGAASETTSANLYHSGAKSLAVFGAAFVSALMLW
ncbi:hypothetical protein HDU84_001881 [Entophlyctis sp. JEL0112]|nr:hypothetical protein HDU84_001881 [Entophlyctis sp. JEL0112]